MTAKMRLSFLSLWKSRNRREEKKLDWMLVSTNVTHERILPAFYSYDWFARSKKTTRIVICLIECIITKTKYIYIYVYLFERSVVYPTRSILIRKKSKSQGQISSTREKERLKSKHFSLFFLSTYVYMNWLLATCKDSILSFWSYWNEREERGKKPTYDLSYTHRWLAVFWVVLIVDFPKFVQLVTKFQYSSSVWVFYVYKYNIIFKRFSFLFSKISNDNNNDEWMDEVR